jgi:uncharacterized membrane protein
MRLFYWVNVTVHVVAASFWMGGILFLAVVGAPALRQVQPPELRRQLFDAIGRRFRWWGWGAIAVLIATGMVNLYLRGWLVGVGGVGSARFWRSLPGHLLAYKLVAVSGMVTATAIHDFVLGPAAGRVSADPVVASRQRDRARLLARLGAVFGLLAVMAAVRLARGV